MGSDGDALPRMALWESECLLEQKTIGLVGRTCVWGAYYSCKQG